MEKRHSLVARNFPSAEEEVASLSEPSLYAGPDSSYRLAFADTEFLLHPELRPVRIQLELLKPEFVQREQNIRSTIVIFGSSRIVAPEVAHEELARAQASGDAQRIARAHTKVEMSRFYDEARRFGALVTLVIFGVMPPAPIPLLAVAGITTFFVVDAYTGLFLVSVTMYPPAIQNAGVGYVVGFGRIGAIIGPSIGGFLLSAGLTRMDTYFVFSAIAVIPVVAMHFANRLAARGPRHKDTTSSGAFDAEPAV